MPSPPQTTTPALTTLDPLFPELRLRILSHVVLSPATLRSFVQTCRKWHDAYLPALYADVTLHRGNASKFFYGMGAQFGPPLAVMNGRQWLERLRRERDGKRAGVKAELGMNLEGDREAGGEGEGEKVAQTERKRTETKGWELDGYWSQTPAERLQTRVSLVQRLELLDGEACLQTSDAIAAIQATSEDLHNDGREVALFPACRSIDMREELFDDLGRHPTAYDDFQKRMSHERVPLPLADKCSVVRIFLPDGPLPEGYLVTDILEDVAYDAEYGEIHNVTAKDVELFGFSHFHNHSFSFYLQSQTSDPSRDHGNVLSYITRMRDRFRRTNTIPLTVPSIVYDFEPVRGAEDPAAAFQQILLDRGWDLDNPVDACYFKNIVMKESH
ncbi:hypothetical protein IAT38_002140 [Cryptococcus sp. DSM 104549]